MRSAFLGGVFLYTFLSLRRRMEGKEIVDQTWEVAVGYFFRFDLGLHVFI